MYEGARRAAADTRKVYRGIGSRGPAGGEAAWDIGTLRDGDAVYVRRVW